jgi:hypothetical protein
MIDLGTGDFTRTKAQMELLLFSEFSRVSFSAPLISSSMQ